MIRILIIATVLSIGLLANAQYKYTIEIKTGRPNKQKKKSNSADAKQRQNSVLAPSSEAERKTFDPPNQRQSISPRSLPKRRVSKPIRRRRVVSPGPSSWEHKLGVDWLNGGHIRNRAESTYNPDNTVFAIDKQGLWSDLNIDYRLTYKSNHKLVLRPRAYGQLSSIEYDESPSRTVNSNSGKFEMTEGFVETWVSDEISLTAGLQNFQWGPAEIISPSNPIFHFNRAQRSVLWREKGHMMFRANWSPSSAWNFVLLSEPISNGDPSFIGERKFKAKNLFKGELRSLTDTQNYIGFTTGTEEEGNPFVGSYFSYMPLEAFTVYSDARATQNAFIYVPQQMGPFYDMIQDNRYEKGTWQNLVVFGLRYEWGTWDLRGEYIVNPRGYNQTDFINGFMSSIPLNPNSQSNAIRFSQPGLEVMAKNYTYLSLRIPDLGEQRQFQIAFRYLHSGMDDSGMLSFVFDWVLGNHFSTVVEARQSFGEKDSEFKLQENSFLFIGFKTLF